MVYQLVRQLLISRTKGESRSTKFFGVEEFFAWILISKMWVKMNLRKITKNNEADPKIRFLQKLILEPCGRTTAMLPAWELTPRVTRVRFLVIATLTVFFARSSNSESLDQKCLLCAESVSFGCHKFKNLWQSFEIS